MKSFVALFLSFLGMHNLFFAMESGDSAKGHHDEMRWRKDAVSAPTLEYAISLASLESWNEKLKKVEEKIEEVLIKDQDEIERLELENDRLREIIRSLASKVPQEDLVRLSLKKKRVKRVKRVKFESDEKNLEIKRK